MLHQEVTHPAMIEEEFYHWRQWHKFLEQHEQREKQRSIGQRHSYAVQQQNSQTANQDNEKQVKEGAWWIIGSKKERKVRNIAAPIIFHVLNQHHQPQRGLSCPTRGESFGRTVSSEAVRFPLSFEAERRSGCVCDPSACRTWRETRQHPPSAVFWVYTRFTHIHVFQIVNSRFYELLFRFPCPLRFDICNFSLYHIISRAYAIGHYMYLYHTGNTLRNIFVEMRRCREKMR